MLDQAIGHFAQAFLGLGLARLPARRTQPVKLSAFAVGAIARQQVDIFNWQVKLGVGGVVELQTIVRRTGHIDKAMGALARG